MRPIPDIEAFEERAAIAEFEAGYSRRAAETLAAQAQGFRSAKEYWAWMLDYAINRQVPK